MRCELESSLDLRKRTNVGICSEGTYTSRKGLWMTVSSGTVQTGSGLPELAFRWGRLLGLPTNPPKEHSVSKAVTCCSPGDVLAWSMTHSNASRRRTTRPPGDPRELLALADTSASPSRPAATWGSSPALSPRPEYPCLLLLNAIRSVWIVFE